MRLEGRNPEEAIIVGGDESRKATINASKIEKLKYMLTNGLYKDGIGSTIVEITNNALDSIIQSGKDPMKNPVYVNIDKVPFKYDQYQLVIKDNGLGLDEEEFQTTIMDFLSSTKEDSDEVIGCFGIGAKSWCAAKDSVTFTCYKNGIERRFHCYKDGVEIKYDKIYEAETEHENGVTFALNFSGWVEKSKWISSAKQKLAYYDNVILTIEGEKIENTIFRSEDFQFSTLNNNKNLHFSLKDVYYTIDFAALGIDVIEIPICLRFGLTDGIQPTPSREDIIYNSATKQLFLDKIKKVGEWFSKKYNKTVINFDSFLDAYPTLSKKDKFVTIEETEIKVNNLFKHCKITPKAINVKGFESANLHKHKDNFVNLCNKLFSVVGDFHQDRFNSKSKYHSWSGGDFVNNKPIILTEHLPVGRFRDFIKYKIHKIPNSYYLRIPVVFKRNIKLKLNNSGGYYQLLELDEIKDKSRWLELIRETKIIEQEILNKVIDLRNYSETEEYQNWLADVRAEEKEMRRSLFEEDKTKRQSFYKALNKQKGEITIGEARATIIGDNITFDKKTIPISNLHKEKFLTIYCSKDEIDDLDFKIFVKKYLGLTKKNSIRFAWVNPREVKHVKNLHNWKTTDKIMFTKALSRYITAKVIDVYLNSINTNRKDLIRLAFPKYDETIKLLNDYVDKNQIPMNDILFKELIISLNGNDSLFDQNIYPIFLQFKNSIKDFHFLNYINVPNYHDFEGKKAVKNLIYTLLNAKGINCTDTSKFKLEANTLDDSTPCTPRLNYKGQIIGHTDIKLTGLEVWKNKEWLLRLYPNCIPEAVDEVSSKTHVIMPEPPLPVVEEIIPEIVVEEKAIEDSTEIEEEELTVTVEEENEIEENEEMIEEEEEIIEEEPIKEEELIEEEEETNEFIEWNKSV